MMLDVNSLLSGVLLVIITLFIKATVKRWKAQDRKQELYYHKTDAMVYALSSIGTSIGEHFKQSYDEKLNELINESKFKYESA